MDETKYKKETGYNEDAELRALLGGFDPQLPSDSLFMSKLERNLDAIEFIHEKNEADARRSKIAVATAAIVGVLTGFLLSLTLPWLCRIMESVSSALKPGTFMMLLADNYLVIFWLITGAASTLLAINTFTATNKILSTQSVK